MTRYIVFTNGPTVGMDCAYAAIADNEKDIERDGFQIAIDHLESYGYDYDPDGEDDYENRVTEVDFHYEIYDPKKHDMHRQGGGSFLDEFKRLEK